MQKCSRAAAVFEQAALHPMDEYDKKECTLSVYNTILTTKYRYLLLISADIHHLNEEKNVSVCNVLMLCAKLVLFHAHRMQLIRRSRSAITTYTAWRG